MTAEEKLLAWVCPDCGQWGDGTGPRFGGHSVPDQPPLGAPICQSTPVLVPLGPFSRRIRQRTKESAEPLIDAAVKLADEHDNAIDGEYAGGEGDTRTAESDAVRATATAFHRT